jgi:DNA-binding NarL/FixJ family response regulator
MLEHRHSVATAVAGVASQDRERFSAVERARPWPNHGAADHQRRLISPSERRVLRAARMGFSTLETAAILHSAPETIKACRARVIRKLGARNITHAVWLACEAGELELPEVQREP